MSKTIGQRIKELREQRNWTQEELAKQLGCAQTTVATWENQPNRAPDKKIMGKVAEIFNVTVDYLFGVEKFESTVPCYGEFSSRGFIWPEGEEYYPLQIAPDEYTPDCFAMKILDNDLEPFILPNDYGIFRKVSPQDRDIVVVRFCDEKNLGIVRSWRCNEDLVALIPTNPYSPERARIFHILKQESDMVKLVPQGKLIVEGVLVGIKRIWEKMS